ncbi:TIGR01777 family oxidoreductase [Massilia sp. NR 4-1]|uniref:TIGR01777 family oxidoreductase n=1 Tax=Massilia sp. NR 4-1 TaxID=1678028 RepID=UPI00067B4035|nr:TIGR01777 family oxidoreductase [Massilia sp. NR 4-1]AKU22725.1 sugar nucleotide epimerase [Massilia sp. NR 4-1]
MNMHLLALQLMALQGCLGAFDTLYHHELSEALPQRVTARLELSIHAARSLIYSLLFTGLAFWTWQGAWAWVLLGLFVVEIVLTLWDFVIEDRSRLLPATERVTHTVLAVNGGAFIALLAMNMPQWQAAETGLAYTPHGGLGVFLALCGVGVGLSGWRDALAARRLWRLAAEEEGAEETLRFGSAAKRFLLTGGTGFIGQLLVRALLRDGHEVILLARSPKQAAWTFDGRVSCVASLDELPAARRIDIVVNLAGATILGRPWTAARRTELRRSRVALTEKLVAWMARAEHKPDLLLSASAIGYYGRQAVDDTSELNEDAAPQDIFMSRLCSEWEQAARGAEAHGVTVVRMRFALVLGQRGALPMLLLPVRLGLGGRLGSGRQTMAWIHVRDLLAGIAHLCCLNEQGRLESGAFNFAAPESLPQLAFSRTAARLAHRPCLLPTPAWPLRLLLGEQTDLLLEGQRAVPRRLRASGFRFRYPGLQGALASLM